jgi:hypothetical protein
MMAIALLLALLAGPAPADPLARLRLDYAAAVADAGAIDRGLAEVAALRESPSAAAPAPPAATLDAYEGALVTLRAKHAAWPPAKLRHLRAGLAILDGVVMRHPEHVEARWLRLMSCYSLPAMLGRKRSVGEDFSALARLLPAARGDLPAEQYRDVVSFVVEMGGLPRAERARLEALPAQGDG